MATPASIQAFIAQAQATSITDAQMVALLDYAIASAIADDGRVVQATGANGFQITMDLAAAQRLRDYYKEEVRKASPMISSTPEFGFFGSSFADFG